MLPPTPTGSLHVAELIEKFKTLWWVGGQAQDRKRHEDDRRDRKGSLMSWPKWQKCSYSHHRPKQIPRNHEWLTDFTFACPKLSAVSPRKVSDWKFRWIIFWREKKDIRLDWLRLKPLFIQRALIYEGKHILLPILSPPTYYVIVCLQILTPWLHRRR